MSKRVCLYARTSTSDQTTDNQILALREAANRAGWNIVDEFCDNGISGAKGKQDRPALNRMLLDCRRRRFDMICCWDISRLGRSLQHLIELMNELNELKVDLYAFQNGIDTTTSSGRMVFCIMGSLAEFERAQIRDRVVAGQQRAKSQGVHIGRPRVITDATRDTIRLMKEQGVGIRKISKVLQVGVSTCYSALSTH